MRQPNILTIRKKHERFDYVMYRRCYSCNELYKCMPFEKYVEDSFIMDFLINQEAYHQYTMCTPCLEAHILCPVEPSLKTKIEWNTKHNYKNELMVASGLLFGIVAPASINLFLLCWTLLK